MHALAKRCSSHRCHYFDAVLLNMATCCRTGASVRAAAEPRMVAAREKLQLRLAAALKLALLEKHASARQHCLLGYAAIGDAAGAEKVRHRVHSTNPHRLPDACIPWWVLPTEVEYTNGMTTEGKLKVTAWFQGVRHISGQASWLRQC